MSKQPLCRILVMLLHGHHLDITKGILSFPVSQVYANLWECIHFPAGLCDSLWLLLHLLTGLITNLIMDFIYIYVRVFIFIYRKYAMYRMLELFFFCLSFCKWEIVLIPELSKAVCIRTRQRLRILGGAGPFLSMMQSCHRGWMGPASAQINGMQKPISVNQI